MIRPHLKFQYLLKSEMNELYITYALRTFAISTIAIFIPLYLLQNGYDMFSVLTYFLFVILFGMTFCYYAFKYVAIKGVKHAIVLSIPFVILYFLGLYNIELLQSWMDNEILLVWLALVVSFAGAFYFMAFHTDFARFSKQKQSAKQVSIAQALGIIASIIGPLFGAMIITYFSFQVLFIIIMVIM